MKSAMMKCQEGDGFSIVQFEWAEMRNDRMSESQGRPIYDKILRVYITSPGQKTQVVSKVVERHFWAPEGEEKPPRVDMALRNRFRVQLEAWENDADGDLTGTPLTQMPGMDVAVVAGFKERGIHTVEALAHIPDGNLLMGDRHARDMAIAYLKQAEGQQPLSEALALIRDQQTRMDEQDEKIAELQGMVEKATKPKTTTKATKNKEAA